MPKLDRFVHEQLETRAVTQDLAAIAAYDKGDAPNGDIFKKAAAETREKIEQYKLASFPQERGLR